jgi:protein arginine N-methyltransferase 1
LAREIAAANGFGETIRFLKGYSLRLELPEKVDVVVADQIGRFGFDAGIIEFFVDARKRFLKPGGRMLPSTVSLWVAPVESVELWRQIKFWEEPHAGLAFAPARVLASNTGYGTKLPADSLLAKPTIGKTVDLLNCGTEPLLLQASFDILRDGNLHGFGGWFSAQLSPSVTMSNAPTDERRINRSNVFLPLGRNVDVRKGDSVQVSMRILPEQVMVSWNTDIFRTTASGQRNLIDHFKQSTFKGMLLSHEDLKQAHPQFVPNLNPWGKARASVVNLCDGTRTVAQIEEEVLRRHSALFPSLDQASAFVAEVVTAYSI